MFLICVSWTDKPECLRLIFVQLLHYFWMLCTLLQACQDAPIMSEKKFSSDFRFEIDWMKWI